MGIALICEALIPMLLKGSEKLIEKIGENAWDIIKKPFQSDKDKALIEKVAENPDDAVSKGIIEYKLTDILEQHPDLVAELTKILPTIAPGMNNENTLNITGNGNKTVQGSHNSTINIS
ncbi:MAG: hypothetical protein JWQ38_2942 [Flavipsychrobacter sp.]|nr:hypothetical protein [Flavipsychrobacter sp.]